MVRVISWNVHGLPCMPGKHRRLGRWAQALVDRAPSLVMLQEMWVRADSPALERALPAGRYHAVSTPRAAAFVAGGLVTLVDSGAWRITGHTFVPFDAHAPVWRVWEADALLGKGLQVVTLESLRERSPSAALGTGRLTVVNTHLQAEYVYRGQPVRYAAIRQSQLAHVLAAVTAAAHSGPVLVAGDFNTTPQERELHAPLLAARWIELTAPLREQHGGGSFVVGEGLARDWLDYVFLVGPPGRPAPAVTASLIANTAPDVPYSDHHGLVVDIPAGALQ
jgi:exonuclease III